MVKYPVYYLASHNLSNIIELLKADYQLIPVNDAKLTEAQSALLASNIQGLVIAEATKLSPTFPLAQANPQRCLILVGSDEEIQETAPRLLDAAYTVLSRTAPARLVLRQIENAGHFLNARDMTDSIHARLEGQTQIMYELNRIGMALSAERNTERLLDMILRKAREMTRSDAASLYLIESDGKGGEQLRFKYTQNESIELTGPHAITEYVLPISDRSIAGFVAELGIPLVIDDVYHMPIEAPYLFNRSFDEITGYYTKSMLVVPMLNAYHYVIGVIQLINHKIASSVKITNKESADRFVTSYAQDLVDVANSLASQAAVALENSMLYQNVKNLFEGFVSASVKAIEQRDPTTSGHSFRVADLTVGLAELVDRTDVPPFSGVNFSRDQMTEIRYASLLHDFGKVGVREEVLVKAKKLYPLQYEILKWRFDYYRRIQLQDMNERKLNYLLERGREEYLIKLPYFDKDLANALAEIDEMWKMVAQSNEPTILAEGSFERLVSIAHKDFQLIDGTKSNLLNEEEIRTLSIPRGSLNDAERREIESHAYHTYVFLSQIPWIDEWKNIPKIAGSHHEKLDGRGYPKGARSNEIPIQSRMMTIADIFDALTASDRPYKRAVPVDKALGIIEAEVKKEQLDGDLFKIFIDSKIYQRVLP